MTGSMAYEQEIVSTAVAFGLLTRSERGIGNNKVCPLTHSE
jgi:hypothetical protein